MKDHNIIPLIVLLPTFCAISFFIGIQIGSVSTSKSIYDTAVNITVKECVENVKNCKVRYDYLKLQEKQND